MAGIKRKQTISSIGNGHTGKRFKKESPPPGDIEAETDSDPIVESDTTDHSGDDDGVSWPSDENEKPEKKKKEKKDQTVTKEKSAQHPERKLNGEGKVANSNGTNGPNNRTDIGH